MISSTANNKVKRLVALGQKAKMRRDEQVFIVEGVRMFQEAPPAWIKEVYVSASFLEKNEKIVREKISGHVPCEVLSDEVFKKVSDTQTPQGVLCVLDMPHYDLKKSIAGQAGGALFLLVEDLQDPGNLGTILRTGEGAGISGVIMTNQTADIFNPKVIRSTMGSIYRVPFFITDNLTDTIGMLKSAGISVYAAHLDESVDYDLPDYTGPSAFLIGNEGGGLRRETARCASRYIKIPMAGRVESLNAAAAATILMYEAARQRREMKRDICR